MSLGPTSKILLNWTARPAPTSAQSNPGDSGAERQIEQLDQEIVRFAARLDQRTLTAPIAGTVQQLATTGPGNTSMQANPDGDRA